MGSFFAEFFYQHYKRYGPFKFSATRSLSEWWLAC
jgi:hypothetical protein